MPELADPLVTTEGRTATHEGSKNFRLRNIVAPTLRGGEPGGSSKGKRSGSDAAPMIAEQAGAVAAKWAKGTGGPAGDECQNLVACFDETQVTHPENRSTAAPDSAALARTARPPAVALMFTERTRPDGRTIETSEDLAYALLNPGAGGRTQERGLLDGEMRVRRLTPLECERLMGLPDGLTAIRYKGKPMSDTARYRLIGNSIVVPILEWLGRRIKLLHELVP